MMPENGNEEYIQVGVTAMRDASGGFLPAVPLYIKATPEARASEAKMLDDIAGLFKDKMKQYIDGGGLIGKPKKR
jgi:hypothetical protein